MKDPLNTDPEASKPPPPSQEENWIDVTGHENIHYLGEANFDSFMKEHNSVLVMFYAPCEYFLPMTCTMWLKSFVCDRCNEEPIDYKGHILLKQ